MIACKNQLSLKTTGKCGRRKQSHKIIKFDDSSFARDNIYDITEDEDRKILVEFLDSVLASNKIQCLLGYDTVRNLEVMKYLIIQKVSKVSSSYWLGSEDFSRIIALCGVGEKYALFRGFGNIDLSRKNEWSYGKMQWLSLAHGT